jgi:hypothetical protein
MHLFAAIISSYHQIIKSSHHHIIKLSNYQIIKSSNHHIITLSNHPITTSSHYHISKSSNYHIITFFSDICHISNSHENKDTFHPDFDWNFRIACFGVGISRAPEDHHGGHPEARPAAAYDPGSNMGIGADGP